MKPFRAVFLNLPITFDHSKLDNKLLKKYFYTYFIGRKVVIFLWVNFIIEFLYLAITYMCTGTILMLFYYEFMSF